MSYFSCFAHVSQLTIEAFIRVVTQVAVVAFKEAIWKFDPQLEENQVVVGRLDIIATIWTLAVKVSNIFESFSV